MILVFGQTGQVARELAHICSDAVFLGREQANLAEPDACAAAIRAHAPDTVINAAAYASVDRAERNEALAGLVNGTAPAVMAQTCAALGIPCVHISTDYVFDGYGTTAFPPDHSTYPVSVYGRSKLLGERGVAEAGGIYAILRTSWVFSAHGSNFVKTMLRLGTEREHLTVVADQIGGPTPARAIASACLSMADHLRNEPQKADIYHFSGYPDTSWAEFARAIVAEAGLKCEIKDIPSTSHPTPAPRLLNSRLDCTSLSAFGLARPN